MNDHIERCQYTQIHKSLTSHNFQQLSDIGEIIKCKGDGNCGFYACMAGLKKFHLVESNYAVHQLRKDMYDYLKGHYKSFFASSSDSSMLKVVNTDGASMPHFRLSHKMLEMDKR